MITKRNGRYTIDGTGIEVVENLEAKTFSINQILYRGLTFKTIPQLKQHLKSEFNITQLLQINEDNEKVIIRLQDKLKDQDKEINHIIKRHKHTQDLLFYIDRLDADKITKKNIKYIVKGLRTIQTTHKSNY